MSTALCAVGLLLLVLTGNGRFRDRAVRVG
jgi:hypothetical protein